MTAEALREAARDLTTSLPLESQPPPADLSAWTLDDIVNQFGPEGCASLADGYMATADRLDTQALDLRLANTEHLDDWAARNTPQVAKARALASIRTRRPR